MSEGELLHWAVEVGDTCEDDCPLLRLSACSHMRACLIVDVGVYGLVRIEESRCVRFNDERGRIGVLLRRMKEGGERIYLHNRCPKHNQTLAYIHIFPYPSLYRPSITNCHSLVNPFTAPSSSPHLPPSSKEIFHSPKMHSLQPNRTIPHPLNPTRLRSCISRSRCTLPSLSPCLLESRSCRTED